MQDTKVLFPLALNCIDVYMVVITASNENNLITTESHCGPNIICSHLWKLQLLYFSGKEIIDS